MIFVDMDGVVANFVGAALNVHQRPELADNWPKGVFRMEEVLKLSTEDFWSRIDSRFEHFWRLLAPYPWIHDLVAVVAATGRPWAFLSSPSKSAASSCGKVQWLQRHFGSEFRDYILTPSQHKKHLSGPGRILIDDNDRNCDQWVTAGGHAILFPQPWNKRHNELLDRKEVLPWLADQLDKAHREIGV